MRPSNPSKALCTTAQHMPCTTLQGGHTPEKPLHNVNLQHPVYRGQAQVRAVDPLALSGRIFGRPVPTPATSNEVRHALHKPKQGV